MPPAGRFKHAAGRLTILGKTKGTHSNNTAVEPFLTHSYIITHTQASMKRERERQRGGERQRETERDGERQMETGGPLGDYQTACGHPRGLPRGDVIGKKGS